MTKHEYLEALRNALGGRGGQEAEELVSDVGLHFDEAAESGLSEDAISERLGPPQEMANEFLQGMPIGAEATATLGTQRGEYENLRKLTVELGHCDAELYPSTDEKTYIDIVDTATSDDERIEVVFESGHLMVRQRRKYVRFLAFFSLHGGEKSSVRIWLGKGFAGDAKVALGSGKITALQVSGKEITLKAGSGSLAVESMGAQKISLSTASGGVKALKLNASQEISVNTASGGITLDEISVPNLKCNLASGGVRITNSRCANAQLNTASGGISFDNYEICSVKANTASGSITLRLPAEQQMTIHARTASGGMNIGYPAKISGEKGRRQFVVGDGSVNVSCTTASGSISINPLD